MDRTAALLGWRQRLEAALHSEDWSAMGEADRALATGLPPLRAAGPWSAAERRALQQLQASHAQARRACAAALAAAGQQLDGMRQQREGWLAYADGQAWETA